jgi:hypothetical protein
LLPSAVYSLSNTNVPQPYRERRTIENIEDNGGKEIYMGRQKRKIMRMIYYLCIILFFIPLACVMFVLGGIDAVCGTDLYIEFFNHFENVKTFFCINTPQEKKKE